MSALTPHIVVLRAEAEMLVREISRLECALQQYGDAAPSYIIPTITIINALANSKWSAAAALEARERELEARFTIPPSKRPTAEEIEAAKTPAGGWDRETLASWGVAWPPPKGWKDALLDEEGGGE